MAFVSCTCPNCHAEVSVESEQSFVFCSNCGTRIELPAAEAPKTEAPQVEAAAPEAPKATVSEAAAAPAGKNVKGLVLAIVGLALPLIFGWYPFFFAFAIAGLIIGIINFIGCNKDLTGGVRNDTLTKVAKWLSLAAIIVGGIATVVSIIDTCTCISVLCSMGNTARNLGSSVYGGYNEFNDIANEISNISGYFN